MRVGDGTLLLISHVGTITCNTLTQPLHLSNVCLVPQLCHNLLSVEQLCHDNNCHIIFNANSISINENTMGEVLLRAPSVGNVYPIYVYCENLHANLALNESGDTWHCHLGHYGSNVLNLVKKNRSV